MFLELVFCFDFLPVSTLGITLLNYFKCTNVKNVTTVPYAVPDVLRLRPWLVNYF